MVFYISHKFLISYTLLEDIYVQPIHNNKWLYLCFLKHIFLQNKYFRDKTVNYDYFDLLKVKNNELLFGYLFEHAYFHNKFCQDKTEQ